MRVPWGKVTIVGAGPGEAELITVKGMRCIGEADVILYDRLVNEELLQYANPLAEIIFCGKAPGNHTMTQEAINACLVKYAREGKHVVRLKGGDPFVFGRGGEELLKLAENGITAEIIPGITSAIGATSSASIPLTHRGLAASFACVTGNRCHGDHKPVRWDLLVHSVDTLAIYMGMSQLADIQSELMTHGKAPSTPVAIIEQGTKTEERVFTGMLSEMSQLAQSNKVSSPALIVIGEVVKVREHLMLIEQQAYRMNKIS